MSEEIYNAAVVVPRAIILGITISGFVGLASYIALLFCTGDLETVLTTEYAYPFIQVFLQATRSVAGSAIMISLIITVMVALALGCMAAASRMLWAFARDRGVPGWRHISKVQ